MTIEVADLPAGSFLNAILFSPSSSFIVLDRAHRVCVWPKVAELLLGWPGEEMLGRALPMVRGDLSSPGQQDLVLRSMAGEELRVEGRLSAVEDTGYWLLELHERRPLLATEEEEAALQLKQLLNEKLRLSRALEQSAEIVVIVSAQGDIEYVNPAFTRTLGYRPEEVLGAPAPIYHEAMHGKGPPGIKEALEQLQPWRGRITKQDKDGSDVLMEVSITPIIDDHNQLVNFIAVERDLRSEIELERQLLQAQRMEAVGRLAGGVAHEFNNMLSVILGNLEFILDAPTLDASLEGELLSIRDVSLRAAELTRQLLGYARKQVKSPEVLRLNGTIANLISLLRSNIPEEIDIQAELAPELWPVRFDPQQIEQVLANIIFNARDAIQASGTIRLRTFNQKLTAEDCKERIGLVPGAYVVIQIEDSGSGVKPEFREHIFEPFFTTKGLSEASGLGLSVAYGIIKQNKGFIYFDSSPQGSTFEIFLQPKDEVTSPPLQAENSPPGGHETVCLVEEEPILLKALSMILERLGYQVIGSLNPQEALELISQQESPIDLLICAQILNGMQGVDFIQLVQQRCKKKPPSLLLISDYYKDLIPVGFNTLSKPFTASELAVKVRQALAA